MSELRKIPKEPARIRLTGTFERLRHRKQRATRSFGHALEIAYLEAVGALKKRYYPDSLFITKTDVCHRPGVPLQINISNKAGKPLDGIDNGAQVTVEVNYKPWPNNHLGGDATRIKLISAAAPEAQP